MSGAIAGGLPILAVSAPFLVVAVLMIPAARSWGLRLMPWATLPALLVALLGPDGASQLPGTLLGSTLVLGETTRLALITTALLWLAASLATSLATSLALGRARPSGREQTRMALPGLLAMGGGLGLALADDGLLWLAAATLIGYMLYALVMRDTSPAARLAGRRLVVLLVLGDLVLFELLLILAQAADGTSFAALRATLATFEDPTLVIVLMILGLGAKAGILGLHAWLLPAFQSTPPATRIALIAFVLGAGLLGWTRLLPLGLVDWPGAGMAFGLLALITAAYALIIGMTSLDQGRLQGCILMVLTAQWLWALMLALHRPAQGAAIAELLPVVALLGSLGLAALVLLGEGDKSALTRQLSSWLAALVVAGSALPLMTPWSGWGEIAMTGLWWPALVLSPLLGRLLVGACLGGWSCAIGAGPRSGLMRRLDLTGYWTRPHEQARGGYRRLRRLPLILLPRWRDRLKQRLAAMGAAMMRSKLPRSLENHLLKWEPALLMAALIGLMAAWLGYLG